MPESRFAKASVCKLSDPGAGHLQIVTDAEERRVVWVRVQLRANALDAYRLETLDASETIMDLGVAVTARQHGFWTEVDRIEQRHALRTSPRVRVSGRILGWILKLLLAHQAGQLDQTGNVVHPLQLCAEQGS
jgi:hypothetical protein